MRLTRGAFVTTFAAALVGLRIDRSSLLARVVPPWAAPMTKLLPEDHQSRDAGASMFRPHLNTTFTVQSGQGARVPMALARVCEGPSDGRFEQFSLVFLAPPDAALPHGIYRFQHAALGACDLFIGPIGGPNVRGTAYEACFSRPVAAGGKGQGWEIRS